MRFRRSVRTVAALLLVGCGTDPVSVAVTDTRSQTARVPAGAAFTVTLATVGPGNYTAPPTISAPAVVEYVTVNDVGPNEPAGERQRFQFRAVARGEAIVVSHHTVRAPTIEDTIRVY
ncbi:hypothetical protein tb265_24510 [Gemmatimonadetes bacterium T265]|nr:hypothetical protein tb265_24510 [Gemmatimonadetes bacterium T265]